MANSPVNLQDAFLNILRRENITTTVFLVNRFQIKGKIKGFDNFTVIMDVDGKTQLVYKHVISTIAPSRPIDLEAILKEEQKTPK